MTLETTMKVSKAFLEKLASKKEPREYYQTCLERLLGESHG
jgi:hypothetical protein